MKNLWLSRRRFLLFAAATMIPSTVVGVSWTQSSWLRRTVIELLLSDLPGAGEIGRRYLASAPEENDPALLAARLFPDHRDVPYAPFDVATMRRQLQGQCRREFATSDTVILDGWIVARSEARLCALAAIA